ncbi:expressed protein [Phakopsora pachyrhizi]|uniref:Expressed protein n=1 Tax=Phakopsora pachyrhizi TaxID=170000 RepID=A0AAV0B270_PHAPC|nr:expressed protein [Phakopsora pachyrhizi]
MSFLSPRAIPSDATLKLMKQKKRSEDAIGDYHKPHLATTDSKHTDGENQDLLTTQLTEGRKSKENSAATFSTDTQSKSSVATLASSKNVYDRASAQASAVPFNNKPALSSEPPESNRIQTTTIEDDNSFFGQHKKSDSSSSIQKHHKTPCELARLKARALLAAGDDSSSITIKTRCHLQEKKNDIPSGVSIPSVDSGRSGSTPQFSSLENNQLVIITWVLIPLFILVAIMGALMIFLCRRRRLRAEKRFNFNEAGVYQPRTQIDSSFDESDEGNENGGIQTRQIDSLVKKASELNSKKNSSIIRK